MSPTRRSSKVAVIRYTMVTMKILVTIEVIRELA